MWDWHPLIVHEGDRYAPDSGGHSASSMGRQSAIRRQASRRNAQKLSLRITNRGRWVITAMIHLQIQGV